MKACSAEMRTLVVTLILSVIGQRMLTNAQRTVAMSYRTDPKAMVRGAE